MAWDGLRLLLATSLMIGNIYCRNCWGKKPFTTPLISKIRDWEEWDRNVHVHVPRWLDSGTVRVRDFAGLLNITNDHRRFLVPHQVEQSTLFDELQRSQAWTEPKSLQKNDLLNSQIIRFCVMHGGISDINYRRKFRSQTSDNMERCKSWGGKSQRREEKKW